MDASEKGSEKKITIISRFWEDYKENIIMYILIIKDYKYTWRIQQWFASLFMIAQTWEERFWIGLMNYGMA